METDLAALQADVAILGIPYGTTYDTETPVNESAGSPSAIRARSGAAMLYHHDFDIDAPVLNGDGRDIAIVDCGDVAGGPHPADGENNRAMATNAVKAILNAGAVPIVFGGDDSVPIPFFAAKAMTRYYMPGKGPITSFIMLPLVIPGIVLGIALLVISNTMGMDLSLWTIAAAHTLIGVPFAMLVMVSRLEGFDKNLEEASLDLGEGAFQTFMRITLPLAWPGILASVLLTFTISFDEFILAFFLAGNEVTLPIYIWSQLRFPNRLPMVLSLGACVLVFSFFIVTFSEVMRRRGVGPQSGAAI